MLNQDSLVSAQYAQKVVDQLLIERGLQQPERWLLTERNGMTWLIGILPMLPKLTPYIQPDVFHSLSTALTGMPVLLSNSTGMRYAILLSGRPRLPEMAPFDGAFGAPDVFDFGVGYRGPVQAHVKTWLNMLVAGGQGSGKSNFLRLIAHTARAHVWQLYLADPDGHTFSAAWNQAAAMPVAGSVDELRSMLGRLEAELARRGALFQEAARRAQGKLPPDDIQQYNQVVSESLERAIFIFDEANTYLGEKGIADQIADLARRGRKWGLHVALAGHNWRANDVSRKLSAMLPTRVCFRVADDTSGEVVLTHSWAKKVMQIRRPGRAVIQLDNLYQPVQTYQITQEQEAAWLGGTPKVEPLSELEQGLVWAAVERLGGQFKVHELAGLLAEQGATEWKVRQIAERFERRGWLTAPADAVSARKVTAELARLGGISLTGSQAS